MLFEQDFHEISKREGQLRKILENTKKVTGGRGGVKGATGMAELRVRRDRKCLS